MWCCVGQRRKNNTINSNSNNINNINNTYNINNSSNNTIFQKALFQLCIPDEVKLHVFSYLTGMNVPFINVI